MDKEEFKFPDEVVQKAAPTADEIQIEVEDDTPPEDRNREPMPKEIVQKLEEDDLEQYSAEAKIKLKQLQKVWHDERREKEAAQREQQEAIAAAKRLLEENKKLKSTLHQGEKTFVDTVAEAATLEVSAAKRAYKEAYDAGDSEALVNAQEALNVAQMKLQRAKEYVQTPLQEEKEVVHSQPQVQAPQPDKRAIAWQERNKWFGTDDEMTSLALGLHNKLVSEKGLSYATTDEYYQTIDATMKRRFPENFSDATPAQDDKPQGSTKPSTVVAPASRSTAPRKIVLKQSQLALARKFGLTPEAYAREVLKLENQNG